MDMIDDLLGCGGALILIGFGLAIVVLLACLAIDTVQERRAFPAIVACEQRQLLPHRKTFSSTVACIPSMTRQDTTTVRVAR